MTNIKGGYSANIQKVSKVAFIPVCVCLDHNVCVFLVIFSCDDNVLVVL